MDDNDQALKKRYSIVPRTLFVLCLILVIGFFVLLVIYGPEIKQTFEDAKSGPTDGNRYRHANTSTLPQ